jgi:hypothetical protein
MGWTHRGIEIDLRGERFAAKVGDKNVILPSVSAVKKAIDKHLEAKAKEVSISLPVIVRIRRDRRIDNKRDRVIHCVITGLDATTMRAVGIVIPEGWSGRSVLPDTAENVKLLEALVDADEAQTAAQEAIEGRSVGTSFAGYGRSKNTYSEALALLHQSYERAKKGKSAE